jgi:hypothetical protein
MNIINDFNVNFSIYYSLIVYKTLPDNLIRELKNSDYSVHVINDFDNLDFLEINNRIFFIDIDLLPELLFIKHDDISQYTIIYCHETYEDTIKIIETNKPNCIEDILIIKIS